MTLPGENCSGLHVDAVGDPAGQPVQMYLVGEPEQVAVSVIIELTIGAVALLFSVQLGGAGGCQVTDVDAEGLAPTALVATTEYVAGPAVADVAEHVDPAPAQFVHAYDVGLPLHEATSVTLVPVVGVALLALTEHAGAVGVGGGVVPPPSQSMSMPARGPWPAAFVPATA